MPRHSAFTLDQYATLEIANDARMRDTQRYGTRMNMHWDPYISSFERQYAFRPTRDQLGHFGRAWRENPNFYHNNGRCRYPQVLTDADWAEYERGWNSQGVYGTWQR
jgi:hypothetical protein